MDNSTEEILAGDYAKVRFVEAKMKTALTLPANTVLFHAEGPQIFLVKEDGRVDMRKVKLGRDFGKMIEILEGVDAKDRVILNPGESLVSGVAVSVSETATKRKVQ